MSKFVKKRTTFILTPPPEQQADDDDIFNRPPRAVVRAQVQTARITCRVCEKPAQVPIDAAGLLCDLCRGNIEVTQHHITHAQQAAQERLQNAWERFDADLAHASPEVDAAWAKVEAARLAVFNGTVTQAAFDEAWRRRKAAGGEFATLQESYEALEQVAEECNRQLEWASRAQAEVEAALDDLQTRKAA